MGQSSNSHSTPTFIGWRYLLQLFLMVVIYMVLVLISSRVLSSDPLLPRIWLPSGMMLAVVMIGGYRYLPVIAFGVMFVGIFLGYPIVAIGGLMLSNMLTIGIGRYLLHTVYALDMRIKSTRDVLLLIHLGGFGIMLLGSIMATLVATLYIDYSSTTIIQQFLTLWFGSSLSVIFITPLIFTWYSDSTLVQSRHSLLESIGLVVFSMVSGWVAYSNILQVQTTMPIFYLMLPPILWAMARFRLREVTLVNAILIGFLLWSSATPDMLVHTMPANDQLVFIWSTIVIGSVVMLLVKVLIDERQLMEQTLKTERNFTTQILETMGQGVSVISKTGQFEFVNPAFAKLLNMDTQDMIGMSPYDVVADSFKPELDTIIKMRQEGKASSYQAVLKNRHGDEIPILTTGVSRYEEGEYAGSISVLTDIRPLLEAEQARMQSEALFRAVFENSADAIIVVDPSRSIVMSNRAQQNLVGYSADELSEMTVRNYIHPDDIEREEALFQHALKHHQDSYSLELQVVRRDKTVLWVHVSVGMVWDKDGNYQYAIGMGRDITESRNIELAIEQSEKRFRAIFENASLPIVVTRRDRKIGMVNRAFCDMIGYSADELQQMKFDDFTYPGDNKENIVKYQQLISGEIDYFTLTKRYIHRDGSIIWANLSVSQFAAEISDTDGEDLYTVAIIEDITERKLAEDRLKAEQEFTENLLDALPGIFYLLDKEGNFLRWNEQLKQVSGFTEEDMKSAKPHDFFPAKLRTQVDQTIHQVFEEGYSLAETLIMHRDGQVTPYLMSGYRINLDDRWCLVGIGTDISNLKATEHALRASEERYRAIFENSLMGIFRSTEDGHFLSANQAMVNLLGYDSEEELYKLDIAKDLYAEQNKRPHLLEQNMDHEKDIINIVGLRLKKKNGDIIITTTKSKVIRDAEGNVLYFDGSIYDITEQYRQAEEIKELNQDLENRVKDRTEKLRQANDHLLDLDRLRAKFIADMSHEMRTPLAVLNTRLYLLEHSKNKDNFEVHIEKFRVQLDRLEEFVENAFDISVIDMSRDNVTFEAVSLNDITEKVIKILAPRAEIHNLDLTYQLDPALPQIIGVESHLSQIISNLVGNAIKYTEVGQVQVTTGIDSTTNQVYLRVLDTGMGVAEEDIPHLFVRFYRGERAGQSTISGTGLGLSIVKEIVDAHGGHIEVDSQINDGSVFTVWLPISSKKPSDAHNTQDDATATRDE